MHRNRNRRRSKFIDHQPRSFGDFAHGNYTGYTGRTPKLTCPSPTTTTTGGARGPRFHGVGDKEPLYDMRETLRSLANWKKHKLCLLSIHLLQRLPERTTSLQSATDDNGTPATWTFGLVFQQAIDRQDRTTD